MTTLVPGAEIIDQISSCLLTGTRSLGAIKMKLLASHCIIDRHKLLPWPPRHPIRTYAFGAQLAWYLFFFYPAKNLISNRSWEAGSRLVPDACSASDRYSKDPSRHNGLNQRLVEWLPSYIKGECLPEGIETRSQWVPVSISLNPIALIKPNQHCDN